MFQFPFPNMNMNMNMNNQMNPMFNNMNMNVMMNNQMMNQINEVQLNNDNEAVNLDDFDIEERDKLINSLDDQKKKINITNSINQKKIKYVPIHFTNMIFILI